MDFATLGVSIKRDGTVEAVNDLERLVPAATKAEKAVVALNRVSRDTAAMAFAKSIDSAGRSLSGFDAIAAKAAQQAGYVTDQMSRITMRDLRADDIAAYGREMDQLRAKFNPLFAASKQYETSLDEINRAHMLGAISAQEQGAAIMRLDAQYELAAQAANKLGAANKSMAGSFHTTNLMFQAQDIAMMSMMGQAPLAVALQQGMQVGGIFHQIGNGKQVIQALGGALAGLMSPINLVTIGVIAIGAASVQAFMSWVSSMGPVERSMEDHQKWLGEILKGYDDINKAVNEYIDTANRMPATLLRIDLGEQMTQTRAQLDSLRSGIETFGLEYRSFLPFSPFQQFNEDMDILKLLRDQYIGGATDAETFAGSLRSIISNNGVSPFVRELAQSLYDMVRDAADAETQLGSIEIAMDRAGQAAQLAAQRTQLLNDTFAMLGNGAGQHGGLQNILDGGTESLEALRKMVPEIRSSQEIAGDHLAKVLGSLPTQQAREEAQALVDLIAKNEGILTARREANRAAGRKERDPYADLTRGAREYITAQQLEQHALGMTAEAASRMRYEQDLLNKAANDNIALTPKMREEIGGLAQAMAVAEEATRRLTEIYTFGKDVFTGFFGDLKSGITEGKSLWESLGNAATNALDKIADKALSMAANGIFDMIFGAVMGGIGGGFGMGSGMPGMSSITGSSGGFFPGFDGGGYTGSGARAGGLDGKGGFMAMLHPQETIIDHTRRSANQNQANDNGSRRGDTYVTVNGSNLTQAELTTAIADALDRYDRHQAPVTFQRIQNDPLARG